MLSRKGVIALNKLVKTADLYDCQVPYLKDLFDSCEYPWEMLPKIKEWILKSLQMPEFDLALAARRQWEERWDCRKNYTAFAKFLASL